jgi:alkanesulfonate monooxygenase SsuD/methylene tetrahydromethanopterin reductase-like flavin-dependent oxidoreductase (luciferase family)
VEIGIGLPATIPGVEGDAVVEWARRADGAGFSSVGVIDRLVYPNYDPLVALAAAAAVTSRIRLTSTVLLGPLHTNAALLAKQTVSLDRLSGGRFVLGIALGARDDDYEVSGLPAAGRGAALDRLLQELKRLWAEADRVVGPAPARPGGPEVLVGGHVEASFRRAARFGDGWIAGGAAPDQFGQMAAAVDAAWAAEGRAGKPRKAGLAYFSLGPRAKEAADWYLHDYYGWLGEIADAIAASAATSGEMVQAYATSFRDAGCDELILFPCDGDPQQVGLLAAALGDWL